MPFQKIDPEKLSQSVVRQIEQLILRGILRPGERLPSERELADKAGVSRPSCAKRSRTCRRRAAGQTPTPGVSCRRCAGVGLFASTDRSVFDP
jgi:GntR family transcriptional repressor for pyruvate dehydrogenase complex